MPWHFRRHLLHSLAVAAAVSHAAALAAPANAGQNTTVEEGANLTTVHVAYASDLSSTKSLLAGMLSVARNLQAPKSCVMHLVIPPLKMDAAKRLISCFIRELERLERTAPQVEIHAVKKHPIDVLGRFLQPEHTIGIVRLFLHEYLPEVPRVIWLDTDTIVTSDLALLYAHPMEHPLAAVREGAPRTFRVLYPTQPWKQLPGVNPDTLVFNAGVLLFDLDRWKSKAATENLQFWVKRLRNAGPQLLVNLVGQVSGNFTELDWRWNVLGLGGVFPPRLEQAKQANVLHWSGANKPWGRSLRQKSMAGFTGVLHKVGVRFPDLGHEKFDFLLMPYLPGENCGEPTFVPM